MELILTLQGETEVSVTFDPRPLLLKDEQDLQKNPVVYGEKLYNALFPQNTLAQCTLATSPERILLVTTSENLDAIPWEYAYGPDGFLVLECPFVRGLPAGQRIAPPLLDNNLHIIAVPYTSGNTREDLEHFLQVMRAGGSFGEPSNADGEAKNDGIDLFQLIIAKTLAVLGPHANKKDEWCDVLMQTKQRITERGA